MVRRWGDRDLGYHRGSSPSEYDQGMITLTDGVDKLRAVCSTLPIGSNVKSLMALALYTLLLQINNLTPKNQTSWMF